MFILEKTEERNIQPPRFYKTLEEAQDVMYNEAAKVLGITADEFKAEYVESEDYDEDTGGTDAAAWTEKYGNNYDWQIYELDKDLNVVLPMSNDCME